MGRLLRRVELLPRDDDDEGEQDRVEQADHAEVDAVNVVVRVVPHPGRYRRATRKPTTAIAAQAPMKIGAARTVEFTWPSVDGRDLPVSPADLTRIGVAAQGQLNGMNVLIEHLQLTDRADSTTTVGRSGVCEILNFMLREFDARLQKGDNPGAWTCVVMDDAAELFGTRGLVKIRARSTASRSKAR